MSVTSLGDLSQSYALRTRNVSLRTEMNRLTTELASGQVADVRDVLAGNFSYLSDIERRTEILAGYNVATTEASFFATTTQQTLGSIQDFVSTMSHSLISAGNSAVGLTGTDIAFEARSTLAGIIGTMNTDAAGRYLFSGTATDQPPLPDVDTVLAEVRTAIAGAATPDDVLAAAQAWFDDPLGFEATLYQGSPDGIAPFNLSETEDISLDIRAIDPALKETLKLVAVAALVDDPALGFGMQEQSELVNKTGQGLMSAQDDVIALRAKVGFVEARIDEVSSRNIAELTSMEFARNELLQVDPFETATKLEEVQFQLQSLYSVTVRMSQLSLVNYL